MEKVKDEALLVKKINNLCKTEITKFTCQFYKKEDEKMTPLGSGVFIKSIKKHFILSASHVLEELTKNELFIKAKLDIFIPVYGKVSITKEEKIDLGRITIDKQLSNTLLMYFSFLPISKLRHHTKTNNYKNYAVLGYPANKVEILDEKTIATTTLYLTQPYSEKAYKHYKFDPNLFFILKIEGKGINISNGKKTKINTKLHGISGCGLWLMIPFYYNNELHIDYRLIGIMTEIRQRKYFCLIANKIKLIIDDLINYENINIKTVKVKSTIGD